MRFFFQSVSILCTHQHPHLGQGTFQSMRLSATQHTSELDGQHCGLVSGRKWSVFTWGSRGWECQQLGFKAARETESEGPLEIFFGQRIGCRKEFYGQPETAEKMLSVKFVPPSYTPKGLFLR